MIDLYSGTPGSGKSLHSASTIYWHLKRNLPVIANFDIRCDLINKKDPDSVPFFSLTNDELAPAWLIEFSRIYFLSLDRIPKSPEDRILLVIDECQLIFNAREWQKTGRAEWLSFFTQHRKYGFRILLVAQFDRMIDRQIRSLIEYEYIHRKLTNFGLKGIFLFLLSGGQQFISVKVWYPLNEKVDSRFFRAKKKYYGLYDTYNTFDGKSTLRGRSNTAAGVAGLGVPAAPAAVNDGIEQNNFPELKTDPCCDNLKPSELAV